MREGKEMIVEISKNKVEVADEPVPGLLLVYEWIFEESNLIYLKFWWDCTYGDKDEFGNWDV